MTIGGASLKQKQRVNLILISKLRKESKKNLEFNILTILRGFGVLGFWGIAGTAWKVGEQKGATGRPVPLLAEFLMGRCGFK
jgi:hypothetical protein